MIMYMCNVICVTNRHLAAGPFLQQLEKTVRSGISAAILREKDLDEAEYEALARKAKAICEEAHVPLYLHSYGETAKKLGIGRLHLPLLRFLSMPETEKEQFREIGVSVHSAEEAAQAEAAGASYVTAGHVFRTDCKKDLAPRGLSFLEEVCRAVRIPVYAIGGITPENAGDCLAAGAAGICLMSSLMQAVEPVKLLEAIAGSQQIFIDLTGSNRVIQPKVQ